MTTFEAINKRYYNKAASEVKAVKVFKKFSDMPLDDLKTEYKHIAYKMRYVSNTVYFKMLPVKNAMARALTARGLTSRDLAALEI